MAWVHKDAFAMSRSGQSIVELLYKLALLVVRRLIILSQKQNGLSKSIVLDQNISQIVFIIRKWDIFSFPVAIYVIWNRESCQSKPLCPFMAFARIFWRCACDYTCCGSDFSLIWNFYIPLSQNHYHNLRQRKTNQTGLKILKPKTNLNHNIHTYVDGGDSCGFIPTRTWFHAKIRALFFYDLEQNLLRIKLSVNIHMFLSCNCSVLLGSVCRWWHSWHFRTMNNFL